MKKFVLLMMLLTITGSSFSAEFSNVVKLRGNYQQGGLVIGWLQTEAVSVRLDKKPVYFDENGIFVIGFDRDSATSRTLSVELPDKEVVRKNLTIQARTYDIQRIDGLASHQVTPGKEVLSRIRKESSAIASARRRIDDRADFVVQFEWPVTGPISGVYGSQRVLNGQPRRPHYGVDIAAPVGTPVKAPAPGIVTFVHNDMYFSGATLVLDHGHGLSSSFLHLSKIYVEKGQRIKTGDVIAAVGATGRVTGAHLDWRMNWGRERVDPQLLVGPMELPAKK